MLHDEHVEQPSLLLRSGGRQKDMPMGAYELEVGPHAAGEIRLSVAGELDLETTPSLLDSILCAGLTGTDGDRVVVDLAGVTFIDSSGLAALVDAHRRLAAQSQQLVVANPDDGVWRIFTLAGIDQILAVDRRSTIVD
jgi:anti-anti-sigma factor